MQCGLLWGLLHERVNLGLKSERLWQHNTHTFASSSASSCVAAELQQGVDCESLTPTPGATQQSVDCESLTPTRGATQQSMDCESLTPTRGATQQSVDCESLTPTRGATQQSVDSKIVTVSSIAPEGWGPREGGNATSPLGVPQQRGQNQKSKPTLGVPMMLLVSQSMGL